MNARKNILTWWTTLKYKLQRLEEKISVINILNICKIGIFLIFLVILGLLLYAYLDNPVLNFFKIKSHSNAHNLLASYMSVLGSILGLVIAVVLVIFEVFRKRFRLYGLTTFWNDEHLKELLFIFIFSVLLCGITSYVISPEKWNKVYDILVILCTFCFYLSLLVVFPNLKVVISKMRSKKDVGILARQINEDVIREYNSLIEMRLSSFDTISLENNPIYILGDIAVKALGNDDVLTEYVLLEATNVFCEIFQHHNDKREVIKAYSGIFTKVGYTAIRDGRDTIFISVFNALRMLHATNLRLAESNESLIELDDAMEYVLDESLRANLDDVVIKSFNLLQALALYYLKSKSPKEDDLASLLVGTPKYAEIAYDPELEHIWDSIKDKYIYIIARLVGRAIQLERFKVVEDGFTTLWSLSEKVVGLDNLGTKQKEAIVDCICGHITRLSIEFAEGRFNEYLFVPFRQFNIERVLEQKSDFSRIPLVRLCEILLAGVSLDYYDESLLDDVFYIARISLSSYQKSNIYREAIIFILDSCDRLSKLMEEKYSFKNENFYLRLYKGISSLEKLSSNLPEINKKSKAILGNFQSVESIKAKRRDSYLTWPKLD